MTEPAMNPDNPNEYLPPESKAAKTLLFLVALASIVIGMAWINRTRLSLTAGSVAPPIVAEGWLNGDAPTKESLAGKVIFLNVWASW